MTWQRILVAGRLVRRFVPQPAFALPAFTFQAQRATCEACANVVRRTNDYDDRELICGACWPNGGAGHMQGCSYVRLPGQACGPDAQLFTPRTSDDKL